MAPSIKWLWHLGAVTTAIYAVVFVIDFGLHLHEGWSIGVRERDWVLDARRDCESRAYSSALMQEECGRIRALPVAVPWHTAVHHVGRHLMAKLTSAIQSAFALVCVLVPLALMTFYCAMRHNHDHHQYTGLRYRGAPDRVDQGGYGAEALRLGSAVWEALRSAGETEPARPASPATAQRRAEARPGSVVLDIARGAANPRREKKAE